MARPTPATERAGGTTSRERTLAHFHPPARSYDGSASGGASSSTPGSHTLASPRTCTVSSPPPSPPPPPPPPFSDATVVAQVTAAPLPLPPGRRRWRTEVTATLAVTTIPAGTGFRKARSWSRYTHPGTRVPKMAEKREAASMPWTMGGGDWDGGASLSSSSPSSCADRWMGLGSPTRLPNARRSAGVNLRVVSACCPARTPPPPRGMVPTTAGGGSREEEEEEEEGGAEEEEEAGAKEAKAEEAKGEGAARRRAGRTEPRPRRKGGRSMERPWGGGEEVGPEGRE